MVTQAIVESNVVTLAGNTRSEANAENDRGKVPDSQAMEHVFLLLKRPPERQQAFDQLIDQLHDPASPHFHQWLTPKQIGDQFGPATSDIKKVSAWLQRHGFHVNTVYPSGMAIDFSGNAGQISAALHTQIHRLDVRGNSHFANMSDSQIPAALAPVITGVVSLHDFVPRPNFKPKTQYTVPDSGGPDYLVTPADLATIYNFNPVFLSGNTGQNQSIYVIEDTDLYTAADWTTFRSTFGLSGYTAATLATIHPQASGGSNCSDPGVNGDDGEAILDAEYASAAAPSAAIIVASCANSSTDGLLVALQNLINGQSPPAIVSLSYLECETELGSAGNAAFNTIFQQGVAEGVSIFVAAGDSGAAGCDYDASYATLGINVNGMASTPNNVAVGGTDFSDFYSGTSSLYWNSTNTATFGSALSYIPEIPWNSSCASELLATYLDKALTGSSSLCSDSAAKIYLSDTAGGGGPSACATGAPSTSGTVSGTCAGYAKPSWQQGQTYGLVGIPNDGVRDLPDISLFAANGVWGHYYAVCYSDPGKNRGTPCTGAPSGWWGGGGTSFASPIMAGIQALANEQAGGPQGNPNYVFYQQAVIQSGTTGLGNPLCYSAAGINAGCVFNDVVLGDMDVPCKGGPDCYLPSGTYGVLSTSTKSYEPAYGATDGWDFATGIGSINVANFLLAIGGTKTTLTSSLNPSTSGALVQFTATVTSNNGTPTGNVTFKNGSTVLATQTLSSGSTIYSTSALAGGSNSITAAFVDPTATFASSTSAALIQTVQLPPMQTTTTLSSSPNPSNGGATVTFKATVSATGATPTGAVIFLDGSNTLATETLSSGSASFSTSTLSGGNHSITAVYAASGSFEDSSSQPPLIQIVNGLATTTKLSAKPTSAKRGVAVTFTAAVSGGKNPTGTVTFNDGNSELGTGTLAGGKATFSTSTLPVGTDGITASYGGDANNAGSTSATVDVTVTGATTKTTLSSSLNPAGVGQSVTFTATIANGSSPSGTVTFKNGTAVLGTGNVSGGKATLATSALPAGTDKITAVYNGDANNSASTSSALSEKVAQGKTKTTLASSLNPADTGQSVTFTATISGGNSPGGTVTFKNGTSVLGTGNISGGKATYTTSALVAGTGKITAAYAGDAFNAGSTSSALNQKVVAAPTKTALTSSLNPASTGQPVTFTATISGGNGASGTVAFKKGSTVLCTGTISAGQASCTTSALTAGTDKVTAVYGGDSNNAGSTSAAFSQKVQS